MLGLPKTPFPVTFRESWLPPAINGVGLPSSVEGGHPLALTGARLGSTVDGVHFTGAVDSNINAGAIHDNIAKLWISFRFKLDQLHDSGAVTSMTLWGKDLDATHRIRVTLESNGKLYIEQKDGATVFLLWSVEDTWNAGQWYHVLASLSDTVPAQRLIIDGGTPVTDTQAAVNTPNGGDFVIGDLDDPGGGLGFRGVIADFVCGIDDLSTAEEEDLYKGIPPADAVNFWPLREGRGVTAYDRGSGGDDGTLDTTASWSFGQVEQPILDLDGMNDVGISSSGVDISGNLTLVWVGKMKSSYDGLSDGHYQVRIRVDGNNQLDFQYLAASDEIIFVYTGNGNIAIAGYADKPAIDDYMIMIGVGMSGVGAKLFINGSLSEFAGNPAAIPAGVATAFIGRRHVADYDLSTPLFIALIDGAFTAKQARAFTQWLKDIYNLPISI